METFWQPATQSTEHTRASSDWFGLCQAPFLCFGGRGVGGVIWRTKGRGPTDGALDAKSWHAEFRRATSDDWLCLCQVPLEADKKRRRNWADKGEVGSPFKLLPLPLELRWYVYRFCILVGLTFNCYDRGYYQTAHCSGLCRPGTLGHFHGIMGMSGCRLSGRKEVTSRPSRPWPTVPTVRGILCDLHPRPPLEMLPTLMRHAGKPSPKPS